MLDTVLFEKTKENKQKRQKSLLLWSLHPYEKKQTQPKQMSQPSSMLDAKTAVEISREKLKGTESGICCFKLSD